MNDKSCYQCIHYKADHEGYSYCGKTTRWLGIYDKAYCCAYYKDIDEE